MEMFRWLVFVLLPVFCATRKSQTLYEFPIDIVIHTTATGCVSYERLRTTIDIHVDQHLLIIEKNNIVCHKIVHENASVATMYNHFPAKFINTVEKIVECYPYLQPEHMAMHLNLIMQGNSCPPDSNPSDMTITSELYRRKNAAAPFESIRNGTEHVANPRELTHTLDVIFEDLVAKFTSLSKQCDPGTLVEPCYYREALQCKRSIVISPAGTDPSNCFTSYKETTFCKESECQDNCEKAKRSFTNCSETCGGGVQYLVLGKGDYFYANCPLILQGHHRHCNEHSCNDWGTIMVSVGSVLILIGVVAAVKLYKHLQKKYATEDQQIESSNSSDLQMLQLEDEKAVAERRKQDLLALGAPTNSNISVTVTSSKLANMPSLKAQTALSPIMAGRSLTKSSKVKSLAKSTSKPVCKMSPKTAKKQLVKSPTSKKADKSVKSAATDKTAKSAPTDKGGKITPNQSTRKKKNPGDAPATSVVMSPRGQGPQPPESMMVSKNWKKHESSKTTKPSTAEKTSKSSPSTGRR